MSNLTREDILKLADLSRLKLSDEEVELFTAEFNEILNYVELLDSVDTKGLEPTYQVSGLTNVMREDVVKSDGPYIATSKELLKNAPATEDGQFKVKRMIG